MTRYRWLWSGCVYLILVFLGVSEIRSIPVQVFYDKNSNEVFRHVGFYAEKEVLEQLAKLGVE